MTKPAYSRDIYTVSRLNRETRALLEASFPLIWVEGEVSNLTRPASGHLYFSLKDDQAQVRCALFRNRFRNLVSEPANGMQVLVRARVSLYEGRGEFQLIVESVEEAGEGALRRAFEALKRRLSQEGLFDEAAKKPLPRLPRRIGVITSPSGAVIHDILTTLQRRFPAIPVLVYPVPVQGEGAAARIAAALRLASRRKDCEVLVLARGGGSLEDLWSFNEEVVARAIYESRVPVVTGVGHETDFTIVDLVADVRAPTPTAAAELITPNQNEVLLQLLQKEQRLSQLMLDRLRGRQQQLDWISSRLLHPRQRIDRTGQQLDGLAKRLYLVQLTALHAARASYSASLSRLQRQSPLARIKQLILVYAHVRTRLMTATKHHLLGFQQQLRQAMQELNTLSPLSTLARGYAIVQTTDTEEIIREASSVNPGAHVKARLAKGGLLCIVEEIYDEKD